MNLKRTMTEEGEPILKMSAQPARNEIILLLAEDDDGHAELIIECLSDTGVKNRIIRFRDGEEVMDFFTNGRSGQEGYQDGQAYLLLLDIRMPKLDGIQVLERVKQDHKLKTIPIIMLTTTDDPKEVGRCHELGCNNYITKPVAFKSFVETLHHLGLFRLIIQVPTVNR